jgi:UDP-N-acetylglucosamine 4,6-dehydratase
MLKPMDSFDGRSILVTGGTGSFGKRFVKTLLDRYKPARLVVFSRDELKQFEMAQEISAPCLRYFIGDVRDRDRLNLALNGIDTIIHAAALKQVPAAEYNPMECIKTNVLGAENIVNAAIARGVERIIALSTDKAVNPINLYGATKLCADKLFIAANHLAGVDGPRFSVVRYGNVIGSRGSVIPLFKRCRAAGKLPITDERMTRFWLHLDQGVDFVMRCAFLMRGGEVFVPKIPSMRIVDLARAIAPECELEIVGVRPAEKLHEVLVPVDDARNTLEFNEFFVIQPSFHEWAWQNGGVYGNEKGKPVPADFEYRSDSNAIWLTETQLRAAAE